MQSKWLGDSQKLVTAIFSLATKLQPSIIFIDEVDGLLGRRRDQDHEATTSLKTEFMQLWVRSGTAVWMCSCGSVGLIDECRYHVAEGLPSLCPYRRGATPS